MLEFLIKWVESIGETGLIIIWLCLAVYICCMLIQMVRTKIGSKR